jgi:hypothetical protein
MRARLIVAAVLAAALMATPAYARGQATEFDGTCTATEVAVTHFPPMTSTLRQTHIDIVGTTGLCSGTVTRGKGSWQVTNAPTPVHMEADGMTSCQLSDTRGTGVIDIAKRWKVRYDYVEPRLGPFGELFYTGNVGGFASDTVHVSQSENTADIVARCGGAGVRTVHVDALVVASHLAG